MIYLKHTNPYGESHYLANIGLPWPSDPTKRLVERTSRTMKGAKEFATLEAARETLAVTGNQFSKEWTVVDENGRVVE